MLNSFKKTESLFSHLKVFNLYCEVLITECVKSRHNLHSGGVVSGVVFLPFWVSLESTVGITVLSSHHRVLFSVHRCLELKNPGMYSLKLCLLVSWRLHETHSSLERAEMPMAQEIRKSLTLKTSLLLTKLSMTTSSSNKPLGSSFWQGS